MVHGRHGMCRFEMITGPMFSGKTTELCRRVYRMQSIGKSVMSVSPSMDTRAGVSGITTHDEQTAIKCAHKGSKLMDFVAMTRTHDAVAIDEAQFFPDLVEYLLELERVGYKGTVILNCLNGDSTRKPWEVVSAAIPLMDDVYMCKAYCKVCNDGTEASFSKCLVTKEGQNLIGGKQAYVATCRRHFV